MDAVGALATGIVNGMAGSCTTLNGITPFVGVDGPAFATGAATDAAGALAGALAASIVDDVAVAGAMTKGMTAFLGADGVTDTSAAGAAHDVAGAWAGAWAGGAVDDVAVAHTVLKGTTALFGCVGLAKPDTPWPVSTETADAKPGAKLPAIGRFVN